MSRAEHEALVRATALAICKSRTCEGASCCQWPANMGQVNCNAKLGYYDDAARDAIAIIAQKLETVTEEMLAAMHTSRALPPSLAIEYWRMMLAASPLFPGKDP